MTRLGLMLLLVLSAAAPAAASPLALLPRLDPEGFPLPAGAVRRLGSARFLPGSGAVPFGHSADGRTIFTSGPSVVAWDATAGQPRWSYAPARTHFLAANLSGDGKTVWVVAVNRLEARPPTSEVVRLDAADGARVGRTPIPYAWFSDPSPAGRLAASGNNKQVDLVDGATGRVVGSWAVPGQETVSALAIAPDGRRVAVGSSLQGQDGQPAGWFVRVVDTETGRVDHEFPLGQPVANAQIRLQFGSEARYLYALINPGQWRNHQIPDSILRGWDLRTGTIRFAFAVSADYEGWKEGPAQALTVSPDGTAAAVGGWPGPTVIYDLPAGKVRCRLPVGVSAAPLFDPAGKVLVVGGLAITQWDTATGKRLPQSPLPFTTPGGLTFSPDGGRLTARPIWQGDLIDWDVRTGREVARLPWPESLRKGVPGWSGNVNPYTRPLVVRSSDGAVAARFVTHPGDFQHPDNGKIVLTDTATGTELWTLPRATNFTNGLAFSANGRFLLSDVQSLVAVYEVGTGKRLNDLKIQQQTNGSWRTPAAGRLYPHPDGRHVAVLEANATNAGGGWSIGVYDLPSGKEVKRFHGGGTLCALAWSADGNRLAAAGERYDPTDGKRGVLFVGNLAGPRLPSSVRSVDAPARAVAISTDGRTLAAPAGDGRIGLWEVASGRLRHTFTGHRDDPAALAFSPDGKLLASSAADGVFLWDVAGELSRPKPDAAALGRAWDDLAADAPRAFRAVRLLAAAPGPALAMLRKNVAAEPGPRADRVPALIKQLDAPAFADRERAEAELKKLADVAADALRAAAENDPSPEVRQRAARVLAADLPRTPDRLRAARAVEAVEWVGTPEAARLLAEWATQSQKPWLAAEASATRARLKK